MSNTMTCPQCSASVSDRFHFCLQCGFMLSQVGESPAQKSSEQYGSSPSVEPSEVPESSAPSLPRALSVPIPLSVSSEANSTSAQSAKPQVDSSQSERAPSAPLEADSSSSSGRKDVDLLDLVLIRSPQFEPVRFTLREEAYIGRESGHMLFKDDPYISPHHATLYYRGDQLFIRDENSYNGVFIRITKPCQLELSEVFIAGEQTCKVESSPSGPVEAHIEEGEETRFFTNTRRVEDGLWLTQLLEGDQVGIRFPFIESSLSIGRQECDLNFPLDRFMSSRHCHISRQDEHIILTDMGSRNGTFIKIKGEKALTVGDFILIGKQILQVQPHQEEAHTHVSV